MNNVVRAAAMGAGWLIGVTTASVMVTNGQSEARTNLIEGFETRADAGAALVSAYARDTFTLERRIAAALPPVGSTMPHWHARRS
ncbi:MAG TPA: hypothetical protein VFD59_14235 [Nocardioidaceae bacterium]|nr:hypothetical protein [Nocardioidaceae bacterium]